MVRILVDGTGVKLVRDLWVAMVGLVRVLCVFCVDGVERWWGEFDIQHNTIIS